MFVMKFSRNLFDYLNKENGITLDDVCKIMHISRKSLTDSMYARREFKLSEIISWCNYVGTDPQGVFYVRIEEE